MTENTEATPLQPDPDSPAGVDIGEGQEQEIRRNTSRTPTQLGKRSWRTTARNDPGGLRNG